MRYRWLPTWKEIPKHLHESALLSHLEELEVNTYYKYAFFQIFNTIGRYSSFSISLKKKSGTLSMHKFFFSVLWRNIFSTFLLFWPKSVLLIGSWISSWNIIQFFNSIRILAYIYIYVYNILLFMKYFEEWNFFIILLTALIQLLEQYFFLQIIWKSRNEMIYQISWSLFNLIWRKKKYIL